MIPKALLAATDGRGVGIATYGGAGLKKTNFVHTLPPPILHLDIGEGGTASLLPWIRRSRDSSTGQWTVYTQEQRESWFNLLREDVRASAIVKPRGMIDVIHFDNMIYESYEHLVEITGGFDKNAYNSLACDSLQEFSVITQTFSKGVGNSSKLMGDVSRSWFGAQERAGMALRKMRNIRDSGIFVYLAGGEDIHKDYVFNPLEKRDKSAPPPEPYSVKGTVSMAGQLAELLSHIPDIVMHARLMNQKITWITEPEMMPGGSAHWDAKDRFGRLEKYEDPNFRQMAKRIYGEDGQREIYKYAAGMLG